MFKEICYTFLVFWLLGFELRASCLLGHTSSPFCSGYFGDKVLLFAQATLDCDLPILHFLP
jgi:hypothetical protein